MNNNITKGYLYVATGAKYIAEAENSAKSLKKHLPNAETALITDSEISESVFDKIIMINKQDGSDWKKGLAFKVNGLLNSPFEMTCFVDTDTYFTDETSELFQILEFYDLLICHSPNDISKITLDGKKLKGYIPYNTGVIVFKKNDRIKKVFNAWKNLYEKNPDSYSGDQPAFMEALLNHDIKIYVLPPVYNFRFKTFNSFPPLKVKILHARSANYSRIESLVNKHADKHRSWSPYWMKTRTKYRRFFWLKQLLLKTLSQSQFNAIKKRFKK
ncbi:MAG: putative nucleotide-diphospho-sugar transferase [Bacteroidota bacterium]